jgi:cytoskeletal protein CcmA (bactofilin family)
MSAGSVIGSGSVVRGNVRGEGSLEILGRIEGDVSVTGDIVVGEGGWVRGNITGGKISVLGAVQGDLRGSEAVLVERGGKVAGDLAAPRIGIAGGALVRGNVRTEGEPALTPVRRPPGVAGPRPVTFSAKPAVKAEARHLPAAVPDSEPPAAPLAAKPKEKEAVRRPPAPVLPSLGKGTRARKKSRES